MRNDDGDQPPSYRILDSQGRLIGCVRVPMGELPLGRGAGTVLLIRDRRTDPSEAGRPGRAGCRCG